jgi:predicted nucleic-acid-binding Zn-ribbon protein
MADLQMKVRKACPKCGISMTAVSHSAGRGALYVYLGIFSLVALQLYVCTGCGYSEFWVDNEENLRKVREKVSR